jgi:hypothetical protein
VRLELTVLLVLLADRLVQRAQLDQQVTQVLQVRLVFEDQQARQVTRGLTQLFLVLLALEDRQVHRGFKEKLVHKDHKDQ